MARWVALTAGLVVGGGCGRLCSAGLDRLLVINPYRKRARLTESKGESSTRKGIWHPGERPAFRPARAVDKAPAGRAGAAAVGAGPAVSGKTETHTHLVRRAPPTCPRPRTHAIYCVSHTLHRHDCRPSHAWGAPTVSDAQP